MPFGLAAFTERKRQRCALIVALVAALGAIGAIPLGIYTIGTRSYFFSETHYFVRADGHFAVKSSFGLGGILTVPVFSVCLLTSVVCWYNSSPPRRFSIGVFNFVMTVLMWSTFVLWIATLIIFIIMINGSMAFNSAIESGITRAMLNYDKYNSTMKTDKKMLDLLHLSKECCGIDGWQSFQWEKFHLHNFSKILARRAFFKCTIDNLCYIPWSCCRKDSGPLCSNQRFDLALDAELHLLTLYEDSCADKLSEIFIPIYNRMAAMWLSYFVVFYILFIGSRWFHTSAMVSMEHGIPLTPGWIFPCGGISKQELLDTFQEHLTNQLAKEGLYDEPFENPYPEGQHPAEFYPPEDILPEDDRENWETDEEYAVDGYDPHSTGPSYGYSDQTGVHSSRMSRRKKKY